MNISILLTSNVGDFDKLQIIQLLNTLFIRKYNFITYRITFSDLCPLKFIISNLIQFSDLYI